MRTQDDIYYDAIVARDYRFDGKFFVGVKTTGIYCRPICPAKPHRENCEFFPDALSAEKAGYRPCLRCRPEAAPLSPAWNGRSTTIQRALKFIANGLLMESGQEALAERLGVSTRHLRRLFSEEIGKTPQQIWSEYRLTFSRQLISETNLPVTDIAFTAGFSSLRRFNEAFKARYQTSPSDFRRRNRHRRIDATIKLKLPFRPPLDWKSLLLYYQSHVIHGAEIIENNKYERVFRLDDTIGALRVSLSSEKPELEMEVITAATGYLYRIVQNIRRMFDLDSDPMLVANAFSSSPLMSELSNKYEGLRIAQSWDPYEMAVWTILGQLVSVEQAGRLIRRLVERYGERVQNPFSEKEAILFPSPEVLANDPLSELPTTRARRETIREFSHHIVSGAINLNSEQDPAAFRERLLRIKGIGKWTADYISLRALGDPDAFPGDDLILQRALANNQDLNIEALKPWRGYAAIYLWKEFAYLSQKRRKIHEIVLQDHEESDRRAHSDRKLQRTPGHSLGK